MIKTLQNTLKQDKERFTVPRSVQDIIPIRRIWPDGVFQFGSKYSKTLRFSDINYAIASKEDKTAMFLSYSELLNALDTGGFYRMAAGEQSRTYTRPGCSTVEVTEDNRLRIHSPTGQTAEFTLSLAENGSYRAAEMAMDGVVRNITYNTATGAFMTAGDSWSISTLVQEKAGFSPGLTDNALYSMALGNHQTRIAGRSGEFLTAGLFLLLGLVLPLLLKPAIALDKFLLGFFYDNSEKLQATDLARGIMLLLGLVVSIIGAIWWCILLFG